MAPHESLHGLCLECPALTSLLSILLLLSQSQLRYHLFSVDFLGHPPLSTLEYHCCLDITVVCYIYLFTALVGFEYANSS